MGNYLGIDCGSVSLNLVLLQDGKDTPVCLYLRTMGRPLYALSQALSQLSNTSGPDCSIEGCVVTGSGRDLIAHALNIPAVNEIRAHAVGVHHVDPRVRTIIEIGGQDSKFIQLGPSSGRGVTDFSVFRMNEICAAGTGAFLDEQAGRLGIPIESFGSLALGSSSPAPIAGRCAVFAKTDMIHRAQEGAPIQDILMGVAYALARNYIANLIKGDDLRPIVSLQGGVMSNAAVVRAFQDLLGLEADEIVVPLYFRVLGALGCALIAGHRQSEAGLSLFGLEGVVQAAMTRNVNRSTLEPLRPVSTMYPMPVARTLKIPSSNSFVVMGLDVGSVSVKGLLIDENGQILKEDYRLSQSRPLETLGQVLTKLYEDGAQPDFIAVTGSGRNLAGSLIDADLIVNEITAQARAAMSFDSQVDTIIEIGGQDSKWILLENGHIKDFEMNRVCAAGTGSFLMEQAERLGLNMGVEFSDAAFAAQAPADLGSRCTVFMESDLIHHQNNGASTEDLAAGVCVSVVQNYLERVASNKPLGRRVMFLGGVAANPAVRAAFEQHTGLELGVPPFFRVSGALGAALKLLDQVEPYAAEPKTHRLISFNPSQIPKEKFTCKGCENQCLIDRYRPEDRVVYQGGLCERWEVDQGAHPREREKDLFRLTSQLLEEIGQEEVDHEREWGILRSPQFYEWFPFWKAFCAKLGVKLTVAPSANRKQFEHGTRYLRVETCLPIKTLAGQISELVNAGISTLFHPEIITEQPQVGDDLPLNHCPYIQASSHFYREMFPVEWNTPVINYEADPDSFRRAHIRVAKQLGFSSTQAEEAVEEGLERLEAFREELTREGELFLNSLSHMEQVIVVLARPYHTADRFLNMDIGGLFQRLGVRAIPADLIPMHMKRLSLSMRWKHHAHMIKVAHAIAADPRLYPVMIGFFGCGLDPFTVRHLREALSDKPMLMLEMDEHTSRAGIITRLEAFLDSASAHQRKCVTTRSSHVGNEQCPHGEASSLSDCSVGGIKSQRKEHLFIPYLTDISYGFAAAARYVGIDANVLPQPDEESEKLGKPHLIGGECFPFALVLGDYIKLAKQQSGEDGDKSLFYFPGAEACRMPQYPVYMEKIRRSLGHSIGVIADPAKGLQLYGIKEKHLERVFLKAWEGMNAYDILTRLYVQIRPLASDPRLLQQVYEQARSKLFDALCSDNVRQGMEEALHSLQSIPLSEYSSKPIVAVTGDYYTRVIPYANNDVYEELERLGAVVWTPPTFSDCLKLGSLKEFIWSFLGIRSKEALRKGLRYLFLTVSEFKVKGGKRARSVLHKPVDLSGREMWKVADRYVNTDLSAGITAPIATILKDVDSGANGILNLFTLNCMFATVITAVLTRALKDRSQIPMLTLVYDSLKKTNEKTRLEAFMEQVHGHNYSRVNHN